MSLLVHVSGTMKNMHTIASTAAAINMDCIITRKKSLRKKILELSRTIDDFDVALQSKNIVEQVLKSKWFSDSKRISVYVSTKGEVMTDSLIRSCLSSQKEVFIPNFQRFSDQMDMIRLQSIQEFCNLDATLWGIRQHSNPDRALNWKNFGLFDIVILPGVAFTKKGVRLGHGKGYYDRFLTEHRNVYHRMPYTVGLALNHQIVEAIPVTNTDVPLDLVLTFR